MNPQFMAGQPPPQVNPTNPMQAYPGGPGMPPPLNNGAGFKPYQPNANLPPPQQNINQKMQSLNLGGPPMQPPTARQYANGPSTQFPQPPNINNQLPFNNSQVPPPPIIDNRPPPSLEHPKPLSSPEINETNHQALPSGGLPPLQRPPSNFGSPSPAQDKGNVPPASQSPMINFSNIPGPPPTSNIHFPKPLAPGQFPPNNSSVPNNLPPARFPAAQPLGFPPTSQALPGQMPPGPKPVQPGQPGMPPLPGQPGMPPLPGQPGMPPLPGQPGMQPLPGQTGMHPLPGQTGMPPLPGQTGMPPLPGQPGMPPLPGQPGIPGMPPLPGQPFQPASPPGNQKNQMQQGPPSGPGFPNQPPNAFAQPGGFQNAPPSSYPGQQPAYPGQQPGYPGQQPGFPGPQPAFPSQQPGYVYNNQQGYPGQQQNQQGYPGQQQNQYGYQQQPPKKLNPDQMPSPIQVINDDQNANGGVFSTSVKGRVPPLVTTDFVVMDQGNASPRYIRSSMYSVPATNEMMKQVAVPFCVVLSPMAEEVEEEQPPPLLDFSVLTGVPASGPIRCGRCKAYMCPAMRFVDAGRHFQCAFCKATTEVPMEYTQYLNNSQHYGQSTPEMSLGCYDIIATKEYCRDNKLPNPPALIFVIDVSYNAIRSGMVDLVVGKLRQLLADLKTPPRVGIITYSSTIHFYNINEKLGQPQMMVVGDIQDVFVPLAHGLLAEPGQADHLFDALSQQIPLMFRENKETETILLPAVQAGLEALKAAECSGKLLVFHCSLPTMQAPGQLLNRDDRKLLGTEKERSILNPQTKVYNEVAQECVGAGCGVELFLFNNSYTDLATVGQLARLTGGGVFKYTYFQAEIDGDRVLQDLNRVLTRPTAYDAVMRVRTSTGVRATDFYGHFFMSNTTDIELATLDSDKAIAVEIKHDDKLTGEDGVYIQVALLYTHISGQRRLRICNLALNVATQMADLYRSCDLDTFINFLAKQAISRLSEHPPKMIKDGIIARCAQTLACYRKHCATPSSIGQLVLPESMKLLPLYANCLLRSDALSGGSDMSCDDRSWAMQAILCADVSLSLAMLYPRLLCINPISTGSQPIHTRCTIEKLADDSLYILENSVHMMLWVGLQTPVELIKDLFGVNTVMEVNAEVTELPVLNTPFSEAVRELIEYIRKQRRRCMRLTVVKQNDKLEMIFRHFLVEDDGRNNTSSYMDFLCHVHKEIRALL